MRGSISEAQFNEIYDYINRHNECGVGMELLVDWLIDGDVMIQPSQLQVIDDAMSLMDLSASDRMRYLREHNVND